MHPHAPQTVAATPAFLPTGRVHRLASAIHRLREVLFELQCAPEPDPVAIDALMRRLARVRARCAEMRVA